MVLTTRPSARLGLPRIKLWRTGAASYPRKSLDDRRSKSRNTESILLTELPMLRSSERRLLVKNLHGAHKETDAEKVGGSVTESSDSTGEASE